MNKKPHLDGLTLIEKKLVEAYATTVIGKVRNIEDVKPTKLQSYVELEIAEREIAALTQDE